MREWTPLLIPKGVHDLVRGTAAVRVGHCPLRQTSLGGLEANGQPAGVYEYVLPFPSQTSLTGEALWQHTEMTLQGWKGLLFLPPITQLR